MSTETAAATQALPGDLFELIYERKCAHGGHGRYDPWADLFRRHGVDIVWRNSGDPSFGHNDPWGLTEFDNLRLQLRIGLSEFQLRGTLAHELAHLDRGPKPEHWTERREEDAVELLSTQRMIDPIVFDALMARYGGEPPNRAVHAALNVSVSDFRTYKTWRKRVKVSTAVARWQRAIEPTPWPAPWIERHAHVFAIATAFAGRTVGGEA